MNKFFLKLTKHGILITLVILIILPIYIMFLTSLKTRVDIFDSIPKWIFFPTISNYKELLFEDNFLKYLKNSLIVGIISTFLTIILSSMLSYSIVRFSFLGKKMIFYFTLLNRSVPTIVLIVPIFILWSILEVEEGLIGLIFFYTAVNLPFTTWLLFGFVKQLSIEIEEAAIIDGASLLNVFWKIILPILKPGIIVSTIFTFRITWNEFVLALVLTNRNSRTLPVATTLYINDQGTEWGKIMAMGSLMIIPPLIFVFLFIKQIIYGVSTSSIK